MSTTGGRPQQGPLPNIYARSSTRNGSFSNPRSIFLAFSFIGILNSAISTLIPSLSHLQPFTLSLTVFLAVACTFQVYQAWRTRKCSPRFQFFKLPAELREHILLYMIERDPFYSAQSARSTPSSVLQRTLARITSRQPKATGGPSLLLVSRQMHHEYTAVLAKAATFTVQIDKSNYQQQRMWAMSHQTVSQLRHVKLALHLTPSMMGAFDPRTASHSPATEWPLYTHVRESIATMPRLVSLDLCVHACGDPLWNPMWLWHWASQTFKQADLEQLRSIRFKMDGPGLGENHIARGKGGPWEWRCCEGHSIREEVLGWLPVRELCAIMYRECAGCQLQKEEAERRNE